MAALLRFGAARACRFLTSYNVRSVSIYQQNSPVHYKEHFLKACQPILRGSRYFSKESPTATDEAADEVSGETLENQAESDSSEAATAVDKGSNYQEVRDRRSSRQGGDFKYQRQVRQLGTLLMKSHLVRTFQEILEREGGITSLQGYQVLRNCGTELLFEKPEERVELAHYFWDQLMEMGVKADVMLYNALLSVYIQNNHHFNPLEILEKMEQNNIDPNRTTLQLLMQGYAQKGDIEGTFKVLEFIKEANMPLTEQVFAAVVTAYGFQGDPESARGVFDLMRENGLEPDLDSYTALLSIYGEAGNMEAIMKIVDEMQEKHVYPNRKVFLAVLDSLSKRGHLGLMRELLQIPIVKSLIEGDLKNLMLAVATRGEINSAFIFLGHMIEAGSSRKTALNPESALLKQVILSGQPTDIILITIGELHKLATSKNVYEDALEISFSKKNPEITHAILQEMLQKKLRVRIHYFYPLLAMYADEQNARGAQEVLNLIGANGFGMTGTVFRFLVKSYGNPEASDVDSFINISQDIPVSKYLLTTVAQLVMASGQLEKLEKTVEYAKKENINPLCISDAFADYLSKKHFDPQNGLEIVRLLNSLECTTGLSTVIYQACEKCSKERVMNRVEFVTLLLREGLDNILESRTFSNVMASLAFNEMPTEFYEFVRVMKECQVQLDIYHYRQMLRMLAYDGKAEAAQFCFEKAAKLEEPTELMYSALIQAYARCPEGGIHARVPKDRNMKRIITLYNEMWERGFTGLTAIAKSASCLAYLLMGNLDKAEEIKRTHGLGRLKLKALFEFMKVYSRRGDVAKTRETYEEIKNEMGGRVMPTIIYNNLLHVYGFHNDIDSQWKVFEEMKKNNVEPNQFSYSNVVRTYLLKDDIDGALKLFQECKELGKFLSDATCLLLLNSMARTGQLEHFESALEDIVTNRIGAAYSMKWNSLLRGLLFCCLHAGKKDLALKLQLEHEIRVEVHSFVSFTESSARRGEVNAVLNAIEFFKENEINPTALYSPLIRAHDARKDPAAIRRVYEQLVAEGVELDDSFLQQYNQILLKYTDTASSEAVSPPQASAVQDENEFTSDEGENIMDEIKDDFVEDDNLER